METKKEAELQGDEVEAAVLNANASVSCIDNELFPRESTASGSAPTAHGSTTKVVFLTVNDVYELFPAANGVGGLAELATMLKVTKKRISRDTHVIVTLNGDFCGAQNWIAKTKAMMVEILNYLGIEFVVLGNHEFDFGAEHMRDLLADAKFTCFGSNVRSASNGELYPGLVDTCVIPLSNGLRLGLFGVVTTVTGEDPFAGLSVVFDDERPHARRCIEELKAQGADAVVALTHFKVADDVRLAMQAPGINLILGGHDHFPVTCAAGSETLIHKSGMDALWLGAVEMTLTSPTTAPQAVRDEAIKAQVGYQWHMLLNSGYDADPGCLVILDKYIRHVEQDEIAQGKLEPLGMSLTALDGRRVTCRTQESNMGNLVADALRCGLGANVGLVNAGYIKGDQLNAPGLVITRKWLEKYLPLVKPTIVVELSLRELKDALTYWLRRYPAMSSSQPHFSGLRVVYDLTDTTKPDISSIRLSAEEYEASEDTTGGEFHQELEETSMDQSITVAMPLLSSMDGWHFFGKARQLRSGPMVRDLVEDFIRQRNRIDYSTEEGRLRVVESTPAHLNVLKPSAL